MHDCDTVSSNTHTVCVVLQSVCKTRLEDTLAEVRRSTRAPGAGYDGPLTEPSIGLVIDGSTLSMAMSDELVEQFVELCKHCRAVLCCRVTPLQKSAVVKLIRQKLRVMTLAVGNVEVLKSFISLLLCRSVKCIGFLCWFRWRCQWCEHDTSCRRRYWGFWTRGDAGVCVCILNAIMYRSIKPKCFLID